jgi:hypothetical protein
MQSLLNGAGLRSFSFAIIKPAKVFFDSLRNQHIYLADFLLLQNIQRLIESGERFAISSSSIATCAF